MSFGLWTSVLMYAARLRLVTLWLSQTARVLADWCLLMLAMAAFAGQTRADTLSAWHLATAVFIAPFLLLAPLNGCLSNGLPRRWVLTGSAAAALAVVGLLALVKGPWLACLALTAIASAVYSPARYAVLPAAAQEARILLPRVNGWIELGGASAIVGGAALGWSVAAPAWPGATMDLASAAVGLLLGLNLLCLLTAVPVHFRSDVLRPETPGRAFRGFFRDLARTWKVPAAQGNLVGLASFQAVVTAASGALLTATLLTAGQGLLQALLLLGLGAALACATASLQANPRRNSGLVPLGATGMLVTLAWIAWRTGSGTSLPVLPAVLLGFFGGLVNVPLRAAYIAAVPADARGNGMAIMNALIYLLITLLSVLLIVLIRYQMLPTPGSQLALLAVLAGAGAVVAWWLLLPNATEQLAELILLPMYRVRAHGPGAAQLPQSGPVLLIGNHSSYLDPFWVGKVIPGHARPLMTSAFYDRPVIHWLMIHVVQAIRIQLTTYRREAPELQEAVEALHQGEVVLMFPEAMLRRKEEVLLRQFAQGAWHILRAAPETPVMVFWIEGGWGSWASYKDGPPLKNKRPDWRRPIDIAFAEPKPLPPEVLTNHRATRAWLMRACLDCRRWLGLEVPAEHEPLTEEEAPAG
jgi:1-acyl-sn-glycerol-3-phosphate acyltransferase